MLQNAKVTAFTVSELLKENQQGGKITPPLPSRLGLKYGLENFGIFTENIHAGDCFQEKFYLLLTLSFLKRC